MLHVSTGLEHTPLFLCIKKQAASARSGHVRNGSQKPSPSRRKTRVRLVSDYFREVRMGHRRVAIIFPNCYRTRRGFHLGTGPSQPLTFLDLILNEAARPSCAFQRVETYAACIAQVFYRFALHRTPKDEVKIASG